jgi:putative acetyltransferase
VFNRAAWPPRSAYSACPLSTHFCHWGCDKACRAGSSHCRHDPLKLQGMATIRRAIFPDDTAAVLSIWREFIANSPVNLDYQGNDAEFVQLPGKYAAPSGCILLAEQDDEVLGCVAFRKVSSDICEMKRMYVRPHARGNQLGRDLVERLIAEARIAGYREMRLDVMEKSVSARRLYESFGFVPAEPVSFNPVPGASFLGLKL